MPFFPAWQASSLTIKRGELGRCGIIKKYYTLLAWHSILDLVSSTIGQ
jgi:hypothetical protein